MVSHYGDDHVTHTRFDQIAQTLTAGDVLVINTSGTMKAALPAKRANGQELELHLSTRLPADLWSVELRRRTRSGFGRTRSGFGPCPHSTQPFADGQSGEQLALPGGGLLTLLAPHNPAQRLTSSWQNIFLTNHHVRLWIATL